MPARSVFGHSASASSSPGLTAPLARDILIVDDEADIRSSLAGILEDEGYLPRLAADGRAALACVEAHPPSLVILDIWLEGTGPDGMAVLEQLRASHPDVPVVMISGHGTIETAVQAMKLGAYDFIQKPFEVDRLLMVIRRAQEAAYLRAENRSLRQRAGTDGTMVGVSSAIAQVRQIIDRVAPTGSRVMISGPAGVGKELVARIIHARSPRHDAPCITAPCGGTDPAQVEASLFGVAGSTQSQGRPGLFEQASGGTLILEETADLPLETQGKLVRVLQEQAVVRCGGNQRIPLDTRVIALSSRDVQEAIDRGAFRADLFYRLNVVPIRIPALRERRDDIPHLAAHFMALAAKCAGQQARAFGDDAMTVLQAYHWPGNVRQLRNVMEWLLIMTPSDHEGPISVDMLPPELSASSPAVLRWEKAGEFIGLPLRQAREVFEREYLTAQVTRFDGNISRTASFVGMERSALHRKLKMLGVSGRDDDADSPAEAS